MWKIWNASQEKRTYTDYAFLARNKGHDMIFFRKRLGSGMIWVRVSVKENDNVWAPELWISKLLYLRYDFLIF